MNTHRAATRVVAFLLALMIPTAGMSADLRAAMLRGNGQVKVNGNLTTGSTTIYVGDRVSTTKSSSATISANGALATLDENSALTFGASGLNVTEGKVVVTSSNTTVTHFSNLDITPASDRARFAVASSGGKYQVMALEGPLSISNGTQNMVLDSGKMLNKTSDEPAPPEPKSKRRKGVIFGLPGWEVAAIGAAVAGAIILGTSVGGSSKHDVSPSRP